MLLLLFVTIVTAESGLKKVVGEEEMDEIPPSIQISNTSESNNQSVEVSKLSGVGEVDTVGSFTFVVEGIFLTTTAIGQVSH